MTKANYVDGFVFTVTKKNFKAYKKMASDASKVWKKFGALEYKECMGDDMHPNTGGGPKGTPFPRMAKARAGETVWFSFITYRNKKHRDAVNKKVMAYFSKKYPDADHQDMPFDMKRMAYGGFKVVVG